MPRRKVQIPIIRVQNRRIILENHTGTINGSIMSQLEMLLTRHGYVKINQNDLVHLASAKSFCDGDLVFGKSDRLKCKVSRRNISKIMDAFDKIVERK
ncbi:hypothetical protein DX130_24685 [Paenibacillus paeoniae]|uniref:LytTR family transcriptional regulator n=1 Tax=Paenibacillus paeoniae TaxID=2292705 RepID=A0A371P0G7_9BACL|nr:hypothetical protein DX130_24685 [Paenibacillus paeoniae]